MKHGFAWDDSVTSARRFVPFALLVGLSSLDARASETYPKAVERALGAPCPPDCTTCHTRPSGGTLTANTPVGISMRRAGLKGGDTGTLFDALATLEAEATDSDLDGAPDVEEIRAGTNPNGLEGKLECWEPEPDEGCAVARSPRDHQGTSWGFGAVFAALAAVARRRRRARGGQSQ